MTGNAEGAGTPRQADLRGRLSAWDILDLAPFRVYVIDLQSREVLYANNERPAERAHAGLKCHQQIYQEERPCLSCRMPELVDAEGRPNGRIVTSERFNEADDHWYQLQEGTMTLPDGRAAMYSIAIDIGAIKEMQNDLAAAHAELAFKNQQLEDLSVTDRLTGLYNRRKLDEVLALECERARRTGLPLAVILADIDHFKSVNDTYGHPAGDQLLVAIAGVLLRGVRRVDTVGRWGGEEFMILCPNTNLFAACAVAESIRASMENHAFPVVGRKTSCFGAAEYRTGESPEETVKRADAALYRAKAEGRNRVIAG